MPLKWLFISFICICFTSIVKGQTVNGIVYESITKYKLNNVFVKNLTTKVSVSTNASGKFEIVAAPNHLLSFSLPGYKTDTVLVIDDKPLFMYMTMSGIRLKEVDVSARAPFFNPQEEYAKVYAKSKVYLLSPSTIFGKEARRARRFKRFLEKEEQERKIDELFNQKEVGKYLPLKDEELENFITLYRPLYNDIIYWSHDELIFYINDSFKKFKNLPPEKRSLPKLN
jgi:hypothetical protein